MLLVILATTPDLKRMQPTETSGVAGGSKATPGHLSGIWQDANAVTYSAGPNMAASHVT